MNKLVDSFKPLRREQILAVPAGKYGDYELLSVCEYFDEIDDRDRMLAVSELILRSPEVSEMVAYGDLYIDLVNYYCWKEEFTSALQWCYALIVFGEQHEDGMNQMNYRLDLANIYLEMGELDIALIMYTHLLHAVPGNIWVYNILGMELPRAGLNSLAIEALDQGLDLIAREDPEELKDQLTKMRATTMEDASSEGSQIAEITKGVLADFQNALILPPEIEYSDDSSPLPYPPQVARLFEIGGEQANVDYDETLAEGRPFIPALIQLAYDRENKDGAQHAVAALQTLRGQTPDELSLLAPWLDQAEGDWQVELLSSTMGKVGGFNWQSLQDYAADSQFDNNIRAAATEALVERALRIPDQKDVLVAYFRNLLTRPEAYQASEEYFIARLVSDIIDLDAREMYPLIKQVFDEDRLEPGWIDLDDIHRIWELPGSAPQPRRDGLYLPLLCKECGRKREHFSEYILVDADSLESGKTSTQYSAHILDHEVICPKCGAVDRYEMTPQANLRIAGPEEIIAMIQSRAGEKIKNPKPNPRVLYFRSSIFGKAMHPLDGLDEYRRRIEMNPGDAMLHAKMGSLLRTLMRYPEALEALRHAYILDPDDPEIILRLALSEHDFGDKESAEKLYKKIIEGAKGKSIFQRMDDYIIDAMGGLRNLNRNQPSGVEIPMQTRDGKSVAHPSTTWRRAQITSQSFSPSKKQKKKTKRGRRRRRK